jgi:hypothetical protein
MDPHNRPRLLLFLRTPALGRSGRTVPPFTHYKFFNKLLAAPANSGNFA